MRIWLRAGEKLYLNGAVLRADRKLSFELLNDATFILQNHVIQAEEATTPLRQVYFVIQTMLIDPRAADGIRGQADEMLMAFVGAADGFALANSVRDAHEAFRAGKLIETLKMLRSLFLEEERFLPAKV